MNGVSFVIPNWNGLQKLRNTLPNLIEVLKSFPYPNEIIIVDDASTDGSLDYIRLFPQVILGRNISNQGFSRTANRGVELASYDVVFIMSNDIIINPSMSVIFDHFIYDTTFAVSPSVYWMQSKSFAYGKRGVKWEKGCFKVVEYPESNSPVYTLFACGGSAAYDRRLFLDLGGFDVLYHPFYWEEIDLSYRAWKRGYAVIHDPRGKVYNDNTGVIKERHPRWHIQQISGRNSYLFVWKNILNTEMIREHVYNLLPLLFTDLLNARFRFPLCFLRALVRLVSVINGRREEVLGAFVDDVDVISLVNANKQLTVEQCTRLKDMAGTVL
ncbi:MAG: glycosyltransferase [Candidatus Auribacter fodinae]|jgi:GT2 family glycosyltransferase|uniref:Glycosyltransferase n=1 Tax=Candidatus Auribacter fodinae TaxID=2093366 RepID=A0A3A4R4U0_9BACT|nr:MAG: glycosyltransferase [Candidatus Auribacter fodinae]